MLSRAAFSSAFFSPTTGSTTSEDALNRAPTRLDDHPLLGTPEHTVFYICDSEGKITHSNRAFTELAAEVGAVAAREDLSPPFPMESEALKAIMRRIKDWQVPVIREESFVLRGELRRFRSIHQGLYGADNRLTGVAGVYQDAEGEASKSTAFTRIRERFDDITQLSSDWMWETDARFQLTYLSPRVTDTLGFLPRELEGKNLLELGVFEPERRSQLFDWSSPFRDTPFQVHDRDGQPRRFLLSGLPYYCANTGEFLGLRGTAREAVEANPVEQHPVDDLLIEDRPAAPSVPSTSKVRDFGLERDLRRALERDQMHLCFHPLIDLASGRVTGVETLTRWIHPERGEVPPDLFIPIAEATGVIVPLGEWVLRTACRQARLWHDAGLPAVRVGINLSPAQFREDNLTDTVRRALRDTGLDPQWLELEITEGMVMDDVEAVIKTLGALRSLGVDLAIDDFGTGYSSLAYLQQFPVNRLKIDRSFVSDICANTGNAAITRAIITLAHDLGLTVIAEGVETQDQFDHLRRAGCDEAQGFHFSRPLTAGKMTDWLGARTLSAKESARYQSLVGVRRKHRKVEPPPAVIETGFAFLLPEVI